MAASAALVSQARFLDNASQELIASSPIVSSYLSKASNVVYDSIKSPGAPSRLSRSCNACGTILLAGWSSSSVSDGKRSKPRSYNKTTLLRCSQCNATTTFSSQRRRRNYHIKKEPLFKPDIPSNTVLDSTGFIAQSRNHLVGAMKANASRKARSKKSSLHSLLSNSKITPAKLSNRPGLDLMDFMKT